MAQSIFLRRFRDKVESLKRIISFTPRSQLSRIDARRWIDWGYREGMRRSENEGYHGHLAPWETRHLDAAHVRTSTILHHHPPSIHPSRILSVSHFVPVSNKSTLLATGTQQGGELQLVECTGASLLYIAAGEETFQLAAGT